MEKVNLHESLIFQSNLWGFILLKLCTFLSAFFFMIFPHSLLINGDSPLLQRCWPIELNCFTPEGGLIVKFHWEQLLTSLLVMLHLLHDPGAALHPLSCPTGPSSEDKAAPFIPATSHKSSHQLKSHEWSCDPSITEPKGDWWTMRLYLCFLLQKDKRTIDFFS